jgi:hypothetical protein
MAGYGVGGRHPALSPCRQAQQRNKCEPDQAKEVAVFPRSGWAGQGLARQGGLGRSSLGPYGRETAGAIRRFRFLGLRLSKWVSANCRGSRLGRHLGESALDFSPNGVVSMAPTPVIV